jgi:hypothetical protein
MVRRFLDGAIAAGIGFGLWVFLVELYPHVQTTTNGWLAAF